MSHVSLDPPALREPGPVSRAAGLLRLIVAPQRRPDGSPVTARSRVEVARQRRAAARARDAHVWRVARAFEAVCSDLDTTLERDLAEIAADRTADSASRAEAADAAVADSRRHRALARTAALAHLGDVDGA